MPRPPARTRLRAVAVATVLVVALAACGAGGDAAEPSAEAQPDGSFPVSVVHKFGTTEIPAEPERVVSIGYQEHDTLFALGVQPVAVRYWYGDETDVIFPWAEEAAGDADPVVLNMPELDFEALAELDPDLIVGVYSGMTDTDYATLTEIAPTVAQTADFIDYGTPWHESVRLIGTALGRAERAEELVTELENRFDDIRDAHPEWADQELAVATYGYENSLSVFASQDPRSRFFTALGFEVPARFDDLAGDLFYATFSFEEADMLEVDVLVWDQVAFVEGGRAAIEADPLISRLDVTTEGRTVFIGELEDAFGWNTVLSIPAALDGLVPLLEEATATG